MYCYADSTANLRAHLDFDRRLAVGTVDVDDFASTRCDGGLDECGGDRQDKADEPTAHESLLISIAALTNERVG